MVGSPFRHATHLPRISATYSRARVIRTACRRRKRRPHPQTSVSPLPATFAFSTLNSTLSCLGQQWIREAILNYAGTNLVDEIIVVNNNASAGTSEQIAGTEAREIFETKQGYGHALLCGIDNCNADLMILSEPDGTFSARDVLKLLAYSDDVPVVLGTRTSRQFIWSGANTGHLLRNGNWAVAKMTELLFNTTILTDMGCTHRLISREVFNLIRSHLNIGGSYFGPQLLLEIIRHKIPFVEIPLNYLPRVGQSSVTGDFRKAFLLGCQMIALVLAYRLGLYRRERTLWSSQPATCKRPLLLPLEEDTAGSMLLLAKEIEADLVPKNS